MEMSAEKQDVGAALVRQTRVQAFTVLTPGCCWIWKHFHVARNSYPQFLWQFLNLEEGRWPSEETHPCLCSICILSSLPFPHPRTLCLSRLRVGKIHSNWFMFLKISHRILGSLIQSKVLFFCALWTPFSPGCEGGKLKPLDVEKGPQGPRRCRGNTYGSGNTLFPELVSGIQVCSPYRNTSICDKHTYDMCTFCLYIILQ